MTRIERGELILQKYRYDEINPQVEGTPVEFFLTGSPDASNNRISLPYVEMEWAPGGGVSIGIDTTTFKYKGMLSFYIFMPEGLNPISARSVAATIEEATTHRTKDYPEGTVTFGASRTMPSRTVANSRMTVFEVETCLLLR